MADLSVNFAGLKLKNPLIAAAGPITTNYENVEKLAGAGIAAIITKTGFTQKEYETWVGRKNIFPYKPVYKYQSLTNGRLLSLPTLSDIPVSEMAKRVEKMKKLNIPIIGSIMGLTLGGYLESARILANAGVDAIELDLCCTIPEFTSTYKYAGQNVNFNPRIYSKLIKSIKKIVTVPVGIKSTVSLYLYARIIEGLIRAKLFNKSPDFITLVGQLDENPGVDLQTLKPLIPHIPTFGWQGTLSKLTYSSLAVFSSTFETNNPFLSASGGIRDLEGVINSLSLGATTVQFQTVILDKGPGIITKILKQLNNYLDEHKIPEVTRLTGMASKDFIPSLVLGRFMLERDVLFGKVYATVDKSLCIGCGVCRNVCTEDAVQINDKAIIDKNRCRGCNLCVIKCQNNAILLENFELVEQLIMKYKDSDVARSFKEFMGKDKIGIMDILTIRKKLKSWGLI